MADLVLYDAVAKAPVRLTPAGTPGGESRPYRVDGRPDLLALAPVKGGAYMPADAEKLKAIVDAGYRHDRVSFPVRLYSDVADPNTICGYAVEKLPGQPLTELLLPGRLADEHRMSCARQVVEPFVGIEAIGVSHPDNHDGNVLVDLDRRGRPVAAYLIDVLAFELFWKGTFHGARTAHPHSLPPELQDVADLAAAPRGFECDRFGLGTLVFKVLTGGHPAFYGWGDTPDVCRRIKERQFACVTKLPAKAVVPPDVLTRYAALPDELKTLLKRALVGDPYRRPSPREWADSLEQFAPPAPPPRRGFGGLWHLGLPGREQVLAWAQERWAVLTATVLAGAAVVSAVSTGDTPSAHPPASVRPAMTTSGGERVNGIGPRPVDPKAFLVLYEERDHGGDGN